MTAWRHARRTPAGVPGKLEIEDVEVGEPGPHEVLVRTVAAGLCHSDLHFMEGKYPYPPPAVLATSRPAWWRRWATR